MPRYKATRKITKDQSIDDYDIRVVFSNGTVTIWRHGERDPEIIFGSVEELVNDGFIEVSADALDIELTQAEVNEWAERNFDLPDLSQSDQKALIALTGVAEEAGEVVRAIRKMCQGIRGTREEWIEEIEKEGADVVIQLMSGFNALNLDLNSAVSKRWASVSMRDWKKFPKNGLTPG